MTNENYYGVYSREKEYEQLEVMFDEMISRRMYRQAREYLDGLESFPKYEHYNKLLNAVEDIQKEFPHHKVNKIVMNSHQTNQTIKQGRCDELGSGSTIAYDPNKSKTDDNTLGFKLRRNGE